MTKAIAKREVAIQAQAIIADDKIELLKRTYCEGATNDEFELFVQVCNRTRLDPFARQIYFIKRKDHQGGGDDKVIIAASIDGIRLQAQRSLELDGQEGPFWCGPDGVWRDVWLEATPPMAAKMVVYRKGCTHPFTAIALWSAYAQKTMGAICPECGAAAIIKGREEYGGGWLCFAKRGGCGAKFKEKPETSTEMYMARWAVDGPGMLAKCVEALVKRQAFPAELSGLYSIEEMDAVIGEARAVDEAKADPEPEKKTPPPATTKPKASTKPKAKPEPDPDPEPSEELPDLTPFDEAPPAPRCKISPRPDKNLTSDQVLDQIVAAFLPYRIGEKELIKFVGKPISEWDDKTRDELGKYYVEIVKQARKQAKEG